MNVTSPLLLYALANNVYVVVIYMYITFTSYMIVSPVMCRHPN